MSAVPPPVVAAMRLGAPGGRVRAAVAVCAVVTAILAFVHLGAPSFWYDEAVSAAFSRLPLPQFALAVQHQDAFYTLYYLVLHPVSRVSESEAALRSLSALAGVGFTIAIAILAQRLAGARAAVVAAILAAFSPFALGAAREARPYSLLIFLATLLTWAFLRAADRPPTSRWILFAAVSVLACYVHLFAIFVVASHALWAFVARRELYQRGLGIALVAIVAAIAPLVLLIRENGNVNSWIARPRIHDLAGLFVSFAGATKALALAAIVVCAAVVLAARRTRKPVTEPWLFLACWLVVPVALVVMVSLVRPIFVPRYLDGVYPAYVLLVAVALARLPLAASAGALALLVALMLKPISLAYHPNNEDWRAATAFVLRNARPGDAIVVYPSGERRAYEYYVRHLDGTAPANETVGAGRAERTPPMNAGALAAARLWVVIASRFGDSTFPARVEGYLRPRAERTRLALRSSFAGPVTVVRYDR